MNKLLILAFFILLSCIKPDTNIVINDNIDVYENVSLDEIKKKIINYGLNNDFPSLKN
tara:strand:- start:580 stop:753 length:174 start_codon:yes stop_codon:yes gene_type:complete